MVNVETSFGKSVLIATIGHYEMMIGGGSQNKVFVLVTNNCLEEEQSKLYCPLTKNYSKDSRFTNKPGIFYVQYEEFFQGLKMLKDEYAGRVAEFRNILVLIDEADLFAKELRLKFKSEGSRLSLFDPIATMREMRLVMVSGTYSGQTGIEELKSAFGVEVLATQENNQLSSFDDCRIFDVRRKKQDVDVRRVFNIKKDRLVLIELAINFAIEMSRTQPVIVMLLNEIECSDASKKLMKIIGEKAYEERALNFSWEENKFKNKCRIKNDFVNIDVKPIIFSTWRFSYGQDFPNYNLERNHVLITYQPKTMSELIQIAGRSNRFDLKSLPLVTVMYDEGEDRLTFSGLVDQLQLNERDQSKLLPTNYPDLIARLRVYIAGLNSNTNNYGGSKGFLKWRKALDEIISSANNRDKWEDVLKPLEKI